MSLPEEPPNVAAPDPGHRPSLSDSPSGSSSGESHQSFYIENLPPDDQCTDYSSVYPGEWRQDDAEGLRELGWAQRPMAAYLGWQPYVPNWSHPQWDPNVEISMDGKMQRAVRGEVKHFMRPMILPGDSNVPRTEYTKRWGINPLMPKTSNNEWRSGLTPTGVAGAPGAERQWTYEESWQSYWFDGFTTQELIDIGAYAPDANIPEPTLPAYSMHPLFNRERWRQPWTDAGLGATTETRPRNFNMKYCLDGKTDIWDAEFNDDLWDALQPSLRLASFVIYSQHPTWLMFLRGPHHMRKVPMDKDGRSDLAKMHVNYRPYQALWHEVDENEMYDNARSLWHLGFDFGQATMGILEKKLNWALYEIHPPNNGSTCTNPDWSISIVINANTIWPLLTDAYPETEKVSTRIKLAMTMLHELSHACHQAHFQIMADPRHFLDGISMHLTDQMVTHLMDLRTEALGTGLLGENGRQYFVENEVSMEEGKSLDNRLWGSISVYFPPVGVTSLRPMILARDWPFTHPEIYHQNAEAVRAGGYAKFTVEPYRTFLLFPRTPVYELYTPIPVSNYSHLMQSSWWENDFLKYGHESLKISSTRPGQSQPLQSTLTSRYNNFNSVLMPLVGTKSVVQFLMVTAPNILQRQNQQLISAWLSRVSMEVARARLMRLRLHYERKTWGDKYRAIRDLCRKTVEDLKAARTSLQNYNSNTDDGSGVVDFYHIASQLDTLFRQDLQEIHRLVDYESRYSQCVAAEYFLKDLDDRRLVRRSMHALLGHLRDMGIEVHGVLHAMADVWREMGASADAAFEEQVLECESLYGRLNAAQAAIFDVTRVLRGNTLGERSGPGGHGPLAGVPAARRELRYGRALRLAAMREYARISDPALLRLIRTWLSLVHFNQDIRLDDPAAEDVVVGGGTVAELRRARDQATGDALAIAYLDRQDQVAANRAQGIESEGGEDRVFAEMQHEMEQLELASEIVDLYAHSFSEGEQGRLRRRSP